MKIRFLFILVAASCASNVCVEASVTELKETLQTLATAILSSAYNSQRGGSRDNILLRKHDLAGDIKSLNDFLKNDFIKFIGKDNPSRQKAAEAIRDDISRILTGIFVVARDLMVFAGREKFGSSSQDLSGSGAQEAMAARKFAKLEAVDILDPTLIPWGESAKAGTSKISVAQSVVAQLPKLAQVDANVNKIAESAQNGKSKCSFQPCRDRFELLIAANNVLRDLSKKVSMGIVDLTAVEKEALKVARKAKR